MSADEVDFARLFKDVRRGLACEHPGHATESSGCLLRYTEATWLLRQIDHSNEVFPVCLGFAAYFRQFMTSTMVCPLCGKTSPASSQFELIPINLRSIISER